MMIWLVLVDWGSVAWLLVCKFSFSFDGLFDVVMLLCVG